MKESYCENFHGPIKRIRLNITDISYSATSLRDYIALYTECCWFCYLCVGHVTGIVLPRTAAYL